MAKDDSLVLKPTGKQANLSVGNEADHWVSKRTDSSSTNPSPMKGQIKRITFEVDGEIHQAIKLEALNQGMTVKELMQTLVEKFLEEKK